MKVEIDNPNLAFLRGDATGTSVPVRVIQAARRRLALIYAVPSRNEMSCWKSLDYKSEASRGEGYCSISVLDGWRMKLRSHQGREQDAISIVAVEETPNDH
jgi:plasmid maintenance system killer protein